DGEGAGRGRAAGLKRAGSMSSFVGPPPESEIGIGALTLGGLLREVVARFGERDAIAFEGSAWTYDRLLSESRALASGLLAAGVGKGTRVAVLMGNRPEWVATAFGVAMTGGVLVPINTYFAPPELEYALRHSDAAWLLGQPHLAGHDFRAEL